MAKAKKTYEQSEEVRELADKLILNEKIDIGHAQVDYVLVYPHISKTCPAKCIKGNELLSYYSKHDYVILLSGEVWDALDDDELRAQLLYHQLLHILVVNDDNTQEWRFELRDHDVKEFGKILDKYGSNGNKAIKLVVSSLNKLDPRAEDKISY